MNEILRKLFLSMLVFPFLVSGCVTTAKNIEETTEFEQAKTENTSSIVFGRIKWVEKEEEKKIGKGVFAMSLAPHLMKMEDKARIIGEVNEGGSFIWTLKKGTYMMHKIAYRDPWSGNYFVIPKVAFDVPENGKIFYVGTLKAEFAPKRDLIGGLSGEVKFSIHDEEGKDYSHFENTFNINSKDFDKSIMVHDQRLPRSIETTEGYNLAVSIMNAVLFGLSQ